MKDIDNLWTYILTFVGVIAIIGLLGLLVAFPIKWTWNVTMPYLFSLPIISWGKAWCLYFLAGCLVKSSLTTTSN